MGDGVREGAWSKLKRTFREATIDKHSYPGPYINSWLRLLIYLFIVFLTGCIYWGWNGIQDLLYKGGAFEELCEGADDISFMKVGNGSYIDCGLRKSNINNLYTMTYTAHFTSSIFGGLLMDLFGPKVIFTFSQFVNLLSWLLICCVPKEKWVLRVSFLLIGFTAETIYMPLLTVSNYFPKYSSLIISCLGSMRSVSFVIPTLLSFIFSTDVFKPNNLYIIGLIYMSVGNLLCGSIGVYLLPLKSTMVTINQILPPVEDVPVRSQSLLSGSNSEIHIDKDETVANDVPESFNELNSDELIALLEPPQRKNHFKHFFVNIKDVFKHPQLFEYILLSITASVFMTAIGFINKAQREIFVTSTGESVVDLYKYFNVLTFVPGPFLGLIMDKIGPAAVMFILHASGIMFYLLVTIDNYYTKLVSCFFYIISASLCLSSIYCYLKKRYIEKYFGTLIGFVLFLVGTLSLTNIPLYDLAVISLKSKIPFNFRPVTLALMGYMIFCALISGCLIIISKKTVPKHIKDQEKAIVV